MIAITGGTVNTITNGVIERGTLLIENGKISAVGADLPIPENAEVIDASGCYVMPGLIDCHTHLWENRKPCLCCSLIQTNPAVR